MKKRAAAVKVTVVSCHTNRALRTLLQVHRLKHVCAYAFSSSGRKLKLPALKGRAAGKRTGQATRLQNVSQLVKLRILMFLSFRA
jgi:hypothetical protein